jgi:5-methyltetrahydrofolate--homocysteine methyltransferase
MREGEDAMLLDEIRQSVAEGNAALCVQQVRRAVDEGFRWNRIVDEALVQAIQAVGERFKTGEIYVPEMMISARAMQKGLEVLEPLIQAGQRRYLAKMVLGTVQGDLHDIGKNLVKMMCSGVGIEVVDVGVDVAPEAFAAAVREHKPQFLGLSALLTVTMPSMKEIIRHFEEAGLRNEVKVLIGGAPVTEAFAAEIGADGYAPDAASAIDLIKDLS